MNIIYDDGGLVRYRGNSSGFNYDIECKKNNGKTKVIIDSNLLNNSNYLFGFGRVLFSSLDDLKKLVLSILMLVLNLESTMRMNYLGLKKLLINILLLRVSVMLLIILNLII